MSIANVRLKMKLSYIKSVLDGVEKELNVAEEYHNTQADDEPLGEEYGGYLNEIVEHLEQAEIVFKKFTNQRTNYGRFC